MPAGIFISYRRREALKEARAVFEKLSREFGAGQVFIDLEGLDYGVDFVESLDRQLQHCEVMLVLIGPGWLDSPDGHGGRRLDDPNDFVRIELRTALQRNIRVVPVLFDGAPMPRTVDLPADLEPLARRNKIDLDFHRFDADIGRLIGSLRKNFVPTQEPVSVPPTESVKVTTAAPVVEPAVPTTAPAPVPEEVPAPVPAAAPAPEPAPAPAKRTRRAAPRPVAAVPAAASVPERPSAFSRLLSSAWSWSAAVVTIGYSVWQFGGFKTVDVGVVLPPAAGPSAPVVVASGVVLPRSISVASAPMIGVAVPRAVPASVPASAAAKLAVGQRFRDCDDDSCPWMVVLPAGSFTMGSSESEPGQTRAESPQHRVHVASFAIGQYEVTFRQWDACVAAGGCKTQPGDEGWGRGQRPVINVSWNDAQQYAKWLSAKTGQAYRLPSEAEWEYAARAGTTTPFAFGERITTTQANFHGEYTYNGTEKGEYRQKTLPVGSLAKNAWMLHDLHGNVWEWVQDCWHDNYQGAPDNGRAWVNGCSNGVRRVLRGGGWGGYPDHARSAYRNSYVPENRYVDTGFRLARIFEH